jgi:hypothetical protein
VRVLVFLTPAGAIVGAAAALPVGAALLRERRLGPARRVLGLVGPGRGAYASAAAGAAAVALLALAAAQPALPRRAGAALRTDAEAYLVLDDSRSMSAVERRGGPTRLERARELGLRLRDALPGVPWGVASFNDRTLVEAFPTGDRRLVADTMAQSVGIGRPTPAFATKRATALSTFAAGGGFFRPGARRRLFVLLTDGESAPFSAARLARQLHTLRARLVVARLWSPHERVYDGKGRDLGYRPDPTADAALATLPPQGIPVVSAGSSGRLVATVRHLLGNGPTARPRSERRLVPLAGAFVLAAILPLAFVLVRTRA